MYDGPKHYKVCKKLKKIADAFNVKLKFKSCIDFEGEYDCLKKLIVVNLNASHISVVSSFFHELGHYIEDITGKNSKFYRASTPLYIQRRISLRAERSADNTGKKLFKTYFPKLRYEKAYTSQEAIEFNKNYYKDGRKK